MAENNLPTDQVIPSPVRPQLALRSTDSHKGDFGRALLIGGSRGMAGAIAMAGMAAARSGAGLVRLAVPDCCLETVAGFSPCAMTIPLPVDAQGRIATTIDNLQSELESATCVAVGPGIGKSRELQRLISKLLSRTPSPLVVDADGLNNLAECGGWKKRITPGSVLTPHPGEWFRLSGVAADDRNGQEQSAIEFADRYQAVVVLKGHQTLVTDGTTVVHNQTGTPAMASGGSGDILTGVIVALICQGLAPRDAAHLAVHVHGLAGQLAEREVGCHVVLPTELIAFLPAAFSAVRC